MASNGQNPRALLNQLMASNPQIKQVLDSANEYGGDFQKAFYAKAQQMNVDPNDIFQMMK